MQRQTKPTKFQSVIQSDVSTEKKNPNQPWMSARFLTSHTSHLSLSLFLPWNSKTKHRILQRSEAKDFLMAIKIMHCKLGDLLFIHCYRLREMLTEHQSHSWIVPVIFDTVTQDDFILGCQSITQPAESLISFSLGAAGQTSASMQCIARKQHKGSSRLQCFKSTVFSGFNKSY